MFTMSTLAKRTSSGRKLYSENDRRPDVKEEGGGKGGEEVDGRCHSKEEERVEEGRKGRERRVRRVGKGRGREGRVLFLDR